MYIVLVCDVCMSLHVYRLVYISLLAYRAAVSVFSSLIRAKDSGARLQLHFTMMTKTTPSHSLPLSHFFSLVCMLCPFTVIILNRSFILWAA